MNWFLNFTTRRGRGDDVVICYVSIDVVVAVAVVVAGGDADLQIFIVPFYYMNV